MSVSQTFGDCNLEINDSREKIDAQKKGGYRGYIHCVGIGVGVGALSGFCLGYFGLGLGFFGFFYFFTKTFENRLFMPICRCF